MSLTLCKDCVFYADHSSYGFCFWPIVYSAKLLELDAPPYGWTEHKPDYSCSLGIKIKSTINKSNDKKDGGL